MTLLEAALKCPKCVVSVMGDHAGEGADAIFHRKRADIEQTGVTFWLMRSPKARPLQVQRICRPFPAYTIFVEPATKGGARPTTKEDAAREYSDDGVLWFQLPKDLTLVTGKLDTGATALVFDMMTTDVSGTLDLWDYDEALDIGKPLRFILGCSTVCAVPYVRCRGGISIPPKYSVAQVVGFLKGKSAIQIARVYLGKGKNFTGQHFWARGYFVSTVGMDEQAIREYIKAQEKEDRRLDQMNLIPE